MTKYVDTDKKGSIRSVEVTLTPDEVKACVHLRDDAAVTDVREHLNRMGCRVLSQTSVNGTPMLVVTGPRTEAVFIDELSKDNGLLVQDKDKKPFDAWKLRSYLGFGGQSLQLLSSVMKGKVDGPLLTFASANLAANGINLAYRAQQRDDPHQLRILKETLNERLAPHLRQGAKPLDIDDKRALLREQNKPKVIDPVENFMRKNSVNVGELGLRYIGAIGMAFPVKGLNTRFAENGLRGLLDDKAPLRSYAGIGSMIGKTIALTSTVPDPYNPKPRTALDTIREKYSFLAGGLVEAVAFSALTYDAFMNTAPKDTGRLDALGKEVLDTSRSLKFRGGYHRDWLSGIGGAMFVGGYIVRSWAKFGERHVNMPELYAHASDTLAMVPHQQLPQALADTASYLAEHFKKTPGLSFNVIYNKLEDDLCRSHHLTLESRAPLQQIASTAQERALDPTAPTSQIDAASALRQPSSVASVKAFARLA